MKLITKQIKLLFILAFAIAYVGCDDDDVVLPSVTADFTFTNPTNTGIVSFINTSENTDTYTWTFGDENGNESTLINPVYVYGNSGTYTVTLEAKNASGATASVSKNVTVNIPDVLMIPVTFDGDNVNYSTITTFDTAFEIVDNPDESGSNANATKVGEIAPNGVAFQGVTFPFEEPVDFSGTNKTIQLEFWSNTPTDVLVKFSGGVSGARDAEVLASHSGSGWETLTFNFALDAVRSFIDGDPTNGQPIVPDGQYSNLDLFVGFNQSLSSTVYVDTIIQVESETGPTAPNVAAPAPTVDEADVISIFSDAYTNINVSNLGAFGVAPSNEELFSGDNVLVYQDLNFSGIEFESTNISSMTNFTFDIWVANDNTASMGIVNGGTDENITTAREDVTASIEGGVWVTIDTPLADLVASPNGEPALPEPAMNIDQLVPVLATQANAYIDNIYFYNANSNTGDTGTITACDGGELINDFETADNSIFNNFGGGEGTIIDNPVTNVNTSTKLGQYVKNPGEVFGGITIGLDSNIPLNAGSFSIDVKSSTVRQLLFKLEGLNIELIQPTSGSGWETLNYDFSTVAGNMGDVTGITLIMDNGTAGQGGDDWTIQFDNIRLCTNGDTGGGSGTESPYCDTLIKHFPFSTETISDALLSIEKVDRADGFPALKFTVKTEPNNNKVPDLVLVNSLSPSADGGGNGLEPMDTSVAGQVSIEAFWPTGAPENNETTFQLLWSFEGEDGNWQLFETPTTTISLDVECTNSGGGGGGGTSGSLEGSWIIKNTPGSAGVGPAIGDVSFFDLTTQAAERACFFDDVYIFGTDGSFNIDYGSETFLEGWQNGTGNACGPPMAPYDNSIPATFSYTSDTDTLVLNGMGAFIGLPKVTNNGEVSNGIAEPSSRTYTVTFEDADNIVVSIADVVTGGGDGIWTYKMTRN